LVTPPLALGDHGYSAVYSGDGTFNQSNSSVVMVSAASALGSLALTGSGTATAGATYSLTLPTTDSASDTITQWVVNWGDGSSDNLTSPDSMSGDTHIYQSAGDYLIQAVATASDGNSPATLANDVAPASEWSASGVTGAVTSVAVQPDGSIVTVNSGDSGGPLVRFTSSGQPDGTTFDNVSASIATISSVAIQSIPGGFDILAAGSGYSVARFNSDGSLDTTFGNAGIATPSLATGTAGVGGVGENPQMFVEPDGNIVLAGLEPDSGGGGADDLILAEFQADGQPDDSFGTDGVKTYDLSAAAASCDAAYQPGGDVVAVVGLSAGSGSTEILAFTATGSLVSGFTGSGSFTTTAIKTGPLVAIQPNGSIDVAGGNGSDFEVVQYTASGGTGWTHSSAGAGSVGALAIQSDGRIVAAVDDLMGTTNSWSLYGFTLSGSADSTFDSLGAISAVTGTAAAVAMEPNGDILLAGQGASDAFFAQYSAGGPAITVSELDSAPTGLSLTFDGAAITDSTVTYSGADTEEGGSLSPAEIEGSFTDSGSVQEAHNVTINFGDGTEADPDTTTISLPAGQTTFSYPLPQYAVSGEYTVQVSVADADDSHATSPVSVDVYYASTQPSGLRLTLDQSTVTLGNTVNLSGSSLTDPQSNLSHTVTIIWNTGGGTLDVTTLSLGAGVTTFQANPKTYSATGDYTISVFVSGLDGTTATSTTSVTVDPAPDQVMIASTGPIAWEYGDGDQNGAIVLTRTGDTSESLTVNFKITGTAIAGTDYEDDLGVTAYFAAYQTTYTLNVSPTSVGDGDSVVVTLVSGSGYSVATGYSSAKVLIEANSTASGSGAVSVSMSFFAADGTAEATDNTALVGDVIPFGVRAVLGDTSGETYTLVYDSTLVTVSDASGVVTSGSPITLSTGYTMYTVTAEDADGDVPFNDDIDVDESGYGSGDTGTPCSYLVDTEGELHMMISGQVTPQATPIDERAANVLVGQRIDLSLVRQALGGATTDISSGVTWSLPGSTAIEMGDGYESTSGDYIYGYNTGVDLESQVTEFPQSSCVKSHFLFAWVNSGVESPSARADVVDSTSRKTHSVTGYFVVTRPFVNAVIVTPNSRPSTQFANANQQGLGLGMNGVNTFIATNPVNGNPVGGVVYGVNRQTVGILFQAPVSDGEQGFNYFWVQVIQRGSATSSNQKLNSALGGNLVNVLDVDSKQASFHYPWTFPSPAAAWDSPYVQVPIDNNLAAGTTITKSLLATMWLMCQPRGGGMPVPLEQGTWSIHFVGTWAKRPAQAPNSVPAFYFQVSDVPNPNEIIKSPFLDTLQYPQWMSWGE
jgi:uncharacterized delta-60 repeat protein